MNIEEERSKHDKWLADMYISYHNGDPNAIPNTFTAWLGCLAASQAVTDAVAYQFRTRADWINHWGAWCDCTREQYEDYLKVPKLHDWHYEARALTVLATDATSDEQKLFAEAYCSYDAKSSSATRASDVEWAWSNDQGYIWRKAHATNAAAPAVDACLVCEEGKLVACHFHWCDKCGMEVGTSADTKLNVKIMEAHGTVTSADAGVREAALGLISGADYIDAKAQKYLDDSSWSDHDTGGVIFHYGEAGREYHSALVELAEEIRALSSCPAIQSAPTVAGLSDEQIMKLAAKNGVTWSSNREQIAFGRAIEQAIAAKGNT
jgi:hypothetical protein